MTRRPLIRIWALSSLIAVFLCCAGLIWTLASRALPALRLSLIFGSTPPLAALQGSPVWDGLWPACVGTLILLFLVGCSALPLGLGCGFYLALSTSPWVSFLETLITLLAGVPSIVLGLFGFELLVQLHRYLFPYASSGLWLATLCLTILVLPPLVLATKESLKNLPPSLYESGRALGLTEGQLARRVLWPSFRPTLGPLIALTLGRAAEDTAVIMLTGAVVAGRMPRSLLSKFDALPFFVYYKSGQYIDGSDLTRAFAAALLLLALSLICSLLAGRLVTGQRNKKHE